MEEEEEVDMAEGEEVEIDVEEEEDLLYPLELEEGDWVVLLSELEESLEELHGGAGAVGGGSVVSAGVGGGRSGGSLAEGEEVDVEEEEGLLYPLELEEGDSGVLRAEVGHGVAQEEH